MSPIPGEARLGPAQPSSNRAEPVEISYCVCAYLKKIKLIGLNYNSNPDGKVSPGHPNLILRTRKMTFSLGAGSFLFRMISHQRGKRALSP